MGKAIPVDLGIRKFRTKGEATEFFQGMLHGYAPGDRVSARDGLLLAELLKRHPEAKLKIGSGVDHFEVDGAEFGSQCFHVHRLDGTYEDFSLHACVNQF